MVVAAFVAPYLLPATAVVEDALRRIVDGVRIELAEA